MKKYKEYKNNLQLEIIKVKVLNDNRFGFDPKRKGLVGKTVEVYDALFYYHDEYNNHDEYMLYTTREFTKNFSTNSNIVGYFLPVESTSYNREKKLKRILKDDESDT